MALAVLGRYAVAGVSFTLRGDARAPAADLLARLARLARGPRRTELTYDLLLRPRRKRVVRDGRTYHHSPRPADVLDILELDLYHQTLQRTQTTPLHAAGLVAPAGAVLLVGPSGAGKSTLAQLLLERGWGYLTDEHAFLHEPARASGFPRALQLEAGEEPRRELLPPGEQVVHTPTPVAAVVLLERPRAPGAEPAPVAPTEATAHLATHLLRRPRPEDLAALAALAAATPVYRLARRGAASAADAVASLAT